MEIVAAGSPKLVGPGARVDVLVTREDRGTRLALQDVEVLAARAAEAADGDATGAERVAATLRVTVKQAVYLTAAQAFAREVRLLPRGAGDAQAVRAGRGGGGARMTDALDALASTLRERLVAEPADGPAADRIAALVEREAALLDSGTRAELVRRVTERALGLGPLQPLLEDPEVDEIMVSGLRAGVGRAARPAGGDRRRLRDRGPAARRHRARAGAGGPPRRRGVPARRRPPARRLARERRDPAAGGRRPRADDPPLPAPRRSPARTSSPAGRSPSRCWTSSARAVAGRCNVLVCGGTGSGKTTTLNVAGRASSAPAERVVTIEDAAELRLPQPHVVRLEARPPSLEGRGEVPIRALVRNALRMRPDRIIVGEVRGAEALDMLSALSCGHDGSLCTVHAGSPAEALRRVETLALMAGVGLPHAAIREQVADALHLVVCQARAARRHAGSSPRSRRSSASPAAPASAPLRAARRPPDRGAPRCPTASPQRL